MRSFRLESELRIDFSAVERNFARSALAHPTRLSMSCLTRSIWLRITSALSVRSTTSTTTLPLETRPYVPLMLNVDAW